MEDLCADVILGLDFQKQHEAVTIKFNGSRPSIEVSNTDTLTTVCSLAKADVDYPSLFDNLENNVKPIATKSRYYSKEDRNFIAEEIEKLKSEDIIKERKSPWRAQIVVVKDETDQHRKRLCVDYSTTINVYTNQDAYPLPKIEDQINELCKYKYFSTFDLKSAYHQIPIKEEDRPFTAFEANGKLYQYKRIPFGVINGVAAFQRIVDKIVEQEKLTQTFPYLDNIAIAGHTKEEHDSNLEKFSAAVKRRNLTLNKNKSVLSVQCINILGYQVSRGSIKPDPDRLKPLQQMAPSTTKSDFNESLGCLHITPNGFPITRTSLNLSTSQINFHLKRML